MDNEQQQQESKQDESLRRRLDEERRQMLRSLQAHASLPGPGVRQGLPPFTSNIPSVAFGWPLNAGHLNYTPSVASAVAASRHGGTPRENPSLAAALDLQKAIELRLLQYQTERIVAEQLEQRRFQQQQQAQLIRQLQHQAASTIPLALGHYPAFAVLQPNSADFLAGNSVGAYSAQDYYNLLGFNNPRGAAALQINPNLRSHGSILPLNNPTSSFQPANSLENYHLEQVGYLPQNYRQQEIQQEYGFSGISPTTEATTSTRASSEVEAKSSTASGCHGNSHPYFRQCSTLEKLFKKGKSEQETRCSAKEKDKINDIQNQTNSIGEEKLSVSRTESELVEIKAKARAFAMLGPVMQGGRKKKQELVQVNTIKNPMPPATLPEREQLERPNEENRTISNPYKADDENTFQVSETDILNRIPEDASSVFYLFDRKINMDAQPPNASLYSLIRSWVQDDPCRVIPEKSNLMDFVAPSRGYYSMNSNTCTNNNKKRCLDRRKISVGTQSTKPRKVNMMQYLSSTSVNKEITDESLDIHDLLKEHVKHAKKIRNKRFSEREVEFQNIRPRLRRLGINV